MLAVDCAGEITLREELRREQSQILEGHRRDLCRDRDEGIDDDRDVERRWTLSRSGPSVPPRITPDFDYQVAEAVDDLRIVVKVGCALDVANRPEPARHP